MTNLKLLMTDIGFPAPAIGFFESIRARLDEEDVKILTAWRELYISDESQNEPTEKAIRQWAEDRGINPLSALMFFLLFCALELEKKYAAARLPRTMFIDIMHDLTCKLIECRKLHHVWGTFVFGWFQWHYTLKRFALGRFQYERVSFGEESYEKHGVSVKNGDTVINFHIPSSGPIPYEVRLDSYRRAYEFFKVPEGGRLVLVCSSWLLNPESRQLYPEGSNLLDFMNDFDILHGSAEDGKFSNAWRVFYCDFDGDASKLPRDTTFQRNVADWLAKGKGIGHGYGVIVFDGEKILTRNDG